MYRKINFEVMSDTQHRYETIPELISAVKWSIENQFMVAEEENIVLPVTDNVDTRYIVSGKRSFEAAKEYKGKKVAVLNYANNVSIGGAPYSAGAQEESLCRCSTLLPCLQAMKEPFYMKHRKQARKKEMNFMGNDDLIYTPNVVVFKSDLRTDPVYPQMLSNEEWYKVNVITCAAPVMIRVASLPDNYETAIRSRIKRILDVAAKERNEVIILGAWGCGAFKNPIEIVARVFAELVKNYQFEIVEFALATRNDVRTSAFARALQ
jgi:uncharacterized protein (TIGR02452 family)